MKVTVFMIIVGIIFLCIFVGLLTLIVRALLKYIHSKDVRQEKSVVRKSLGEALKVHRTQCKMTQEFVAETIGVSRQAVSKWEAGSSLPEIEKLIFLSDFFQVSIDYLLRDKQINTNFSEDLDRMVIKFLGSSYEMADISRQLVDIMEDGIIDDAERVQMEDIICTMDKISDNIEKIRKAIDLTYSFNSEDF